MLTLALILAVVLVLAAAAYIPFIRRKLVTDRVLALYRRILPDMSQTEKEALDALGRRSDLGDGAQLARAGRAAAALRHRRAEEPLPAAAGERPRNTLLRAHQPRSGLRRRVDPRYRGRVPRHVAGQRGARDAGHLGQALHHPGTRGDAVGPRVSALRPRQAFRFSN